MDETAGAVEQARPLTFLFADDGLVPNNPLPFLVYRGAIDVSAGRDPAAAIEHVFARHGWGDMWRNGIYPFTHYHSRIHEALGIVRGRARVRFGGKDGEELEVAAGDVAVLPAGTGHQRLSASHDLLVVGAYPPAGTYDLCRATASQRERAKTTIPQVPLPQTDPVHGRDGPLLTLWRK
jgi:uncharacterized protein YjlB